MKKIKLFEVSLINKAYSRVVRDTTRFYTSDTALEIGFKLAEAEYSFDSGVILLLNEDDRSVVVRDLVREGAGFIYTLEDDIIEHYGNWAAQLKFEKDGETYVSSPVGFSIHNDLYNSRPPKLSEVNTWKNLRKIADGLIDDLQEELEALEIQELAIATAESERQSAEDIRIENENQREIDHANRSAELEGKADKVVLKNSIENGDMSDGLDGWRAQNSENILEDDYLTNTGDGSLMYPQIWRNVTYGNNEKYFISFKYKTDASIIGVSTSTYAKSVTQTKPNNSSEDWYIFSDYVNPDRTDGTLRIYHVYNDSISAEGSNLSIDDVVFINTTQTFGAGNEPTKEEMDELIKVTGYIDGEYALNNKEMLGHLMKGIREKANKEQEEWITPTLLNGATESPVNTVRYMKDEMGFVHFSGAIRGTAGVTSLNVPPGYRFSENQSVAKKYIASTSTTRTVGDVQINYVGNVYITPPSSDSWVYLDGISYKAGD